jgi:RHS repeat-associated protein
VRGVVAASGALQEARLYDPYGNPINGAGYDYDDTLFGFTGEQTDANSLLFLRARTYAPGLGTFTSLDPMEGGMNTPMTLNRYAYVGGNPINRTDASGMFWLKRDFFISSSPSLPVTLLENSTFQ